MSTSNTSDNLQNQERKVFVKEEAQYPMSGLTFNYDIENPSSNIPATHNGNPHSTMVYSNNVVFSSNFPTQHPPPVSYTQQHAHLLHRQEQLERRRFQQQQEENELHQQQELRNQEEEHQRHVQQQQQRLLQAQRKTAQRQQSLSDLNDIPGMPTMPAFDKILNDYILSLSPKKRDKALIPVKRYENIMMVLRDPKCTTIESAQFRFWAKKMFRLYEVEPGEIRVFHEGKPVACREQLYDVLTRCHGDAQHGGRDKTSAAVRSTFSWVPKELIARFVRNCPTCIARRNPPPDFSHEQRARQNAHQLSQAQGYPPVPVYHHSIATVVAASEATLPQYIQDAHMTTNEEYVYPPIHQSSIDPQMWTPMQPMMGHALSSYENV